MNKNDNILYQIKLNLSEEIFKPTYSKFISNRFCCSLIGITSSYNEKIKINSDSKIISFLI